MTTTTPTDAPSRHPSLPDEMLAVVQDRYGDANTLELRSVPRPSPGPGQVLVEVEAAAVDRGTVHLMTGLPYLIRLLGYGFRRPAQPVPGLDVAGRVVATGDGVTQFVEGDRVFGIGTGAFAQFALAEETKLARRPEELSAAGAAALAVSGGTALQAVCDLARVAPGERVLIVGASGGVGSYATQIARALGAHVTGVASRAKHDAVVAWGAEATIDHRDPAGLAANLACHDRFDVVIDTGGRHPLRTLREAMAPDGRLVIVGGEGGDRWVGGIGRQLGAAARSPFVRQELRFFVAEECWTHLSRLAELVATGDVVPTVDRVVPLERTADAVRSLERGEVTGKLVLAVGSRLDLD